MSAWLAALALGTKTAGNLMAAEEQSKQLAYDAKALEEDANARMAMALTSRRDTLRDLGAAIGAARASAAASGVSAGSIYDVVGNIAAEAARSDARTQVEAEYGAAGLRTAALGKRKQKNVPYINALFQTAGDAASMNWGG